MLIVESTVDVLLAEMRVVFVVLRGCCASVQYTGEVRCGFKSAARSEIISSGLQSELNCDIVDSNGME